MSKLYYLFLGIIFYSGLVQAQGYPTPPGPDGMQEKIYQKAGYGSQVAYAKSGVLELGGSISYISANDFSELSLNPSVGWFFADNIQVSGIASYHNIDANEKNITYWTLLAEPSYHLPFNNKTFGFIGLGIGIAYADNVGSGTALQPRVGANFLLGRSGIITPSLFVAYNSIDSFQVSGVDYLTVNQISGFNLGYTVIW